MTEITFEIDGRKVNPNRLGDALEKAILQSVQESIRKKVGAIRCPKHGQTPKVICKGRSVNNLSFEVTGCCQDLIDTVVAKLK